ncbi:hypothetical protein ABT160_22995 [Streptomyces sp. NPDC001941]|uniref:hypothetical protein n=1 Tax=Streptomyces sp. NPDC001941 TaxID=3154659 RepID=UPI00331F811E
MTTASSAGYPEAGHSATASRPVADHYVETETKPSFKTTELIVYVAVVLAVLIASALVGAEGIGDDRFTAAQAWWYVTLLTIGYLISRGLAKSGSRGTVRDMRGTRDTSGYDSRV